MVDIADPAQVVTASDCNRATVPEAAAEVDTELGAGLGDPILRRAAELFEGLPGAPIWVTIQADPTRGQCSLPVMEAELDDVRRGIKRLLRYRLRAGLDKGQSARWDRLTYREAFLLAAMRATPTLVTTSE